MPRLRSPPGRGGDHGLDLAALEQPCGQTGDDTGPLCARHRRLHARDLHLPVDAEVQLVAVLAVAAEQALFDGLGLIAHEHAGARHLRFQKAVAKAAITAELRAPGEARLLAQ
jgi:hypothetical protein